MSDEPVLRPNDAALELLREMATDARISREHIGQVQQKVAVLEGIGIVGEFSSINDDIEDIKGRQRSLDNRIGKLEAMWKPFKWSGGKIIEGLLTALAAAGVAIASTHIGGHKP